MSALSIQQARDELHEKLARLRHLQARIRRAYAERDALEADIRMHMRPGTSIDLGRYTATCVDNFADGKNLCYGHGPVRRFDVQIKPKKGRE